MEGFLRCVTPGSTDPDECYAPVIDAGPSLDAGPTLDAGRGDASFPAEHPSSYWRDDEILGLTGGCVCRAAEGPVEAPVAFVVALVLLLVIRKL